MDHLWTPWRSTYIKGNKKDGDCVFCQAAASRDDRESLVIYRARYCFLMLNRFPYTSGHLMIAPYVHVPRLAGLGEEAAAEMMRLLRYAETAIEQAYKPDGLNFGMNLGEAAGAGISAHIHLHVLPRWRGDANFMTTVSETRIIPESLDDTFEKLKAQFAGFAMTPLHQA